MSGNDFLDDRPLARDSDRFEVSIGILENDYIDPLIVCLARQGYAPYFNADEKEVCITVQRLELTAIESRRQE